MNVPFVQGVESFEILQSRLKETNNTWSNNILKHWETLPPTLLKVIFKAVTELKDKSPLEILDLEKQLNAKWRQTDDYQKWLESGTEWVTSDNVDFYFDKLEMPDTDDVVVYEAPQETQDETPMVCPVTGQSSGAVCPVTGQSSAASASCPVTGQSSTGDDSAAVCPATGKTASTAVCPVSGKSDASTDESSGCPFSKGQTIADDKAVCPVTGQSASTNNA